MSSSDDDSSHKILGKSNIVSEAIKNARLIVRNLPFKASEEDLKTHFARFGEIQEVTILKKPNGTHLGCGFVHFREVGMANNALVAVNKKKFMGRPLRVGWAVPKSDKKVDNQNPKHEISKKNDNTIVRKPAIKDEPKDEQNKTDRKGRLIIRNISFKTTDELLKKHFEPFGNVLEVKILKKPNGKLVGCAFVQFENFATAKKAIMETNLKPFLGRPVSVDWAVAKDKYMRYQEERRLELQEQVKKEESSDSEDEKDSTLIDDLKPDIKSESDDDSAASVKSEDEDNGSIKDEDDSLDESEDEEQSEDDADNDDQAGQTSEAIHKKKTQLNDAEDGCTVFITNIPFLVDNDMLKSFAEKTGPVKYALICVDSLTEHSKGTGFVKFETQEDAEKFLSLDGEQLKLDGQVMQVKLALKKENLGKNKAKDNRDSRNLYLVKEGVIIAGTKAAVGVSSSDMTKRLALERSKTQMLKNLNRFVSKYRLVVQNLPPHFDDTKLRNLCKGIVPKTAVITEARVMRDLRAPFAKDGKHSSKGFGFVMFMKHEDALMCLRKLNNNPDIFDKNNRPIVSFSIEDRAALNARKKRLEKSIINNPMNKQNEQQNYNKRKLKNQEDESSAGKYVRRNQEKEKIRTKNDEMDEYAGLTSKQNNPQKFRSKFKLNEQEKIHKQNLKLEKKKSKRSLKLKMAAKERIKLPKMKQSKVIKEKVTLKKNVTKKDYRNFGDLVSKYKSKLVADGAERVKSKWYD